MVSHFTLRVVWHDNRWNGKICQDPAGNFYCTAARSVLSERIARNKDLVKEGANSGAEMDSLTPDYLPPCYWSCAAFSPEIHKIVHTHPFQKYEESKQIEEKLEPYSCFSWPFRLSFVHSKERRQAMGNYQKDLVKRIEHFTDKFEPKESVIFYYLNYDNPISGDEEKYALIGCSEVKIKPPIPQDFKFTDEELNEERSRNLMQYFPTMNWALQVSTDFENSGIRLPYYEYLEYIDKHPEERAKLDEMKVLIDEESLVFGFKYVLADISDDQCIYLLTKMRKAIDIIQAHGIVNFDKQQKLIEQLLEKAWKRRGLYPSLPLVLEYIMDNEEWKSEPFLQMIKASLQSGEDLCEKTFQLLKGDSVPAYMRDFTDEVCQLQINYTQHTAINDLLKKLTLFSLKKQQIHNIITLNKQSFSRDVTTEEIVKNPYVLCEEYKFELTDEDLDEEEIKDDSIDLFKIDIGIFPEKYIKGNLRLQNLASGSPERLRAVIKDYLYFRGSQGDCFAVTEDVYDNILEYPLFHKRELRLTKDQLLSPNYIKHFDAKLKIVPNAGKHFFYLNETLRAEEIVRNTITTLLEREDHRVEIAEIDDFVKAQAEELEKDLKCFNEEVFIEERTKVLKNVLKKSFYIISGKPGTGKTKVIEKIIQELNKKQELAVVVAPTGKASLRLKLDCGAKNAQTIDRFVYSNKNGYREVLQDFAKILINGRETERMQNLIIDESSMIDLQKLATLFMMLRLNGIGKINRVIMVGDENQLPPIGFGKPYYDIIQFVKLNTKFRENNYIKLLTNCRNELDPKIIEFADIFAGKNRYYNELLDDLMKKKGDISEGLAIEKWKTIADLQSQIDKRLDKVILTELSKSHDLSEYDKNQKINLLFGLQPSGWVTKDDWQGIENFQIITPYRTERFGCMALSNFFKTAYPRGHWSDNAFFRGNPFRFKHSDKIMRLTNEYYNKSLRLSNGSIGVINNQFKSNRFRQYFFTDQEEPLYSNAYYKPIKEEEDYELAYAITVHKAQGSDFRDVFLVLPGKKSLLSKELLYTALTRAKRSTTVFLLEEEGRAILEEARDRSAILERNTSLFELPISAKDIFEPAKGKRVRSKIEYIIFKALESSGLKFDYEEPLFLEKGPEKIKPDFTVYIGDKTYYWEHLGELDTREYWANWKARRDWYKANGKYEQLVTTDDLGGVKQERIQKVIEDISGQKLEKTPQNEFSDHHYTLYTI